MTLARGSIPTRFGKPIAFHEIAVTPEAYAKLAFLFTYTEEHRDGLWHIRLDEETGAALERLRGDRSASEAIMLLAEFGSVIDMLQPIVLNITVPLEWARENQYVPLRFVTGRRRNNRTRAFEKQLVWIRVAKAVAISYDKERRRVKRRVIANARKGRTDLPASHTPENITRAEALRKHIFYFIKNGATFNPGWTPESLLLEANSITGHRFERKSQELALLALTDWLNKEGTLTMPKGYVSVKLIEQNSPTEYTRKLGEELLAQSGTEKIERVQLLTGVKASSNDKANEALTAWLLLPTVAPRKFF